MSIAGHQILHDVSIDVELGAITTLLGPSGCGKSTFLNGIAGLLPVDNGNVSMNTKNLVTIPAHKRGIGLMFQNNALFPHTNVERNVALDYRCRGKKLTIQKKSIRNAELSRLSGFNKREIGTLSGGESQRVALARA